MKTTLCAVPCALLFLWSPTYGQTDTDVLQGKIDNASWNAETLRYEATIEAKPGGGNWVVRPLRLWRNDFTLTLNSGVVIEAEPGVFTDIFDEEVVLPYPYECRQIIDPQDPDCTSAQCTEQDRCKCEGCACRTYGPYGIDHDNPPPREDPDFGRFNKLILARGIENLTIIGMGSGESRGSFRPLQLQPRRQHQACHRHPGGRQD